MPQYVPASDARETLRTWVPKGATITCAIIAAGCLTIEGEPAKPHQYYYDFRVFAAWGTSEAAEITTAVRALMYGEWLDPMATVPTVRVFGYRSKASKAAAFVTKFIETRIHWDRGDDLGPWKLRSELAAIDAGYNDLSLHRVKLHTIDAVAIY